MGCQWTVTESMCGERSRRNLLATLVGCGHFVWLFVDELEEGVSAGDGDDGGACSLWMVREVELFRLFGLGDSVLR